MGPLATRHASVLLVQSDDAARERLASSCSRGGMRVIEAPSAADALRTVFEQRPSVVVLDAGLRDGTGWAALERIRELCDTPVLMLHPGYNEPAIVQALRAGADDVLATPFGVSEAIARIEALVRRKARGERAPSQTYADALVAIDMHNAEVRVKGQPLALTPLELRLLWELVCHPRQTLSAEHLLEHVWGLGPEAHARVKIYVGYLRGKFRQAGAEAPILTTRGFGYRYEPPA